MDSGDFDGAVMNGTREFMPDFAVALRQVPLLAWLPPIPRHSSAMMLGTFFRMALLMTEGAPGWEDERAAIREEYETSVGRSIDIAAQWEYTRECGRDYATHITFIMAYTWAMLETNPARKARITDEVLAPILETMIAHKNVYGAFLMAGAGAEAVPGAIDGASAQLAQFQPGPRISTARNRFVADYPHDPECPAAGYPQAAKTTAVTLGDRVPANFLWQRHPWALFAGAADQLVLPGVDYLAAYWAGRHHGHLTDNRPGTCTRWRP